jgi:C4-dicarboxylate transporter, DctQ subunit
VFARTLRFLEARAENVAAAMLAVMFVTFIIQIFARYVLDFPVGWTLELTLTMWLWVVFWGAAFCLRESEHVTFDIVYASVSEPVRKIFAMISAAAIVIGFAISLPATWDYIDFLAIRRSPTLRIPLKWVFMVYIVFMVGMIVRYAVYFVQVYRHGPAKVALEEIEESAR